MLACGVWPGLVSVSGKADPEAPVFVVAPHTGLLDALVCLWLSCPRPVAKSAYARLPIVGTLFRALDGIVVSVPSVDMSRQLKKNQVAAEEATAPDSIVGKGGTAAVREAIRVHKQGWDPRLHAIPIAVAPEGTSTNGRCLIRFFPGAFDGKAPVQPMILRHRCSYFNAASLLSSVPAHVLRLLLVPAVRVHATLMPAISPSVEEAADAVAFAETVRQAMGGWSGLPLSSHSARTLVQERAAAAHRPE